MSVAEIIVSVILKVVVTVTEPWAGKSIADSSLSCGSVVLATPALCKAKELLERHRAILGAGLWWMGG